MVRNAVGGGDLVFLRYDAANADPDGRLHPLDGYALSLRRGICTTFPPLFPLLSVPGFRAAGWFGLTILPVLAGTMAVALTYWLGLALDLRSRTWLPWAMGLLTPLPVFATTFWDVSLQVMLSSAAALMLARGGPNLSWGPLVGAGVLLGLGVWFHEGYLLLIAALLSTAVTVRCLRRVTGWLLAGFAPTVSAWLACNAWLFGRLGGAHTAGPNDLLHPDHLHQILNPGAILDRAMTQLVGEPQLSVTLWGVSGCLLGLALGGRCADRVRGASALLYFPLVVLAIEAHQVVQWAGGLFLATPILAPAVAGFPSQPKPDGSSGLELSIHATTQWLMRAGLLFCGLVLLTPKTPGMDWGSRYLLVALPFFLIASARNLEARDAAADPVGKAVIRAAVVLLAATSLYSQCRGLLAVREDLRHSAVLKRQVEDAPRPVLVTDVWWLGAELMASDLKQKRLLVRRPEDHPYLAAILKQDRQPPFLYAGTDRGLDSLTSSRYRTLRGYVETERWRSEGLLFVHFERATGARP